MLSFVYVKTETGRQAFKVRSADIPPKLRSAFILFDGVRRVEEVLSATAGLGITLTEITALVELGYLVTAPHEGASSSSFANSVPDSKAFQDSRSRRDSVPSESLPALPVAVPLTWHQERYKRAYPIAAQLTAGLGLRGIRLHLAVEGALNYEQLSALVPKIRAVLGVGKSQPFEQALAD